MNMLNKAMGWMLTVVAVTALTAGAYGQNTGQKTQTHEWPSFESADKDANGSVDTKEALSLRGFNFNVADKDKNGKIDKSEYETAMKEQNQKGMGKKGS
jgi:Ca2+-binding EF-hand superfamily protein